MSDEIDEILASLRDFAAGALVLKESCERYLEARAKVLDKTLEKSYKLDNCDWIKKQGKQGDFEMSKGGADFEALKADVVAHGGKMVVDGTFVWLFPDGGAIGRKPSRK